jgi:hypothetical protein
MEVEEAPEMEIINIPFGSIPREETVETAPAEEDYSVANNALAGNQDLDNTLDAFDKVMMVEEYQIGVTTEVSFWEDNWNMEDPYDGKIGIVAFELDHKTNDYKYTIGNFTIEYLEGLKEEDVAMLKREATNVYTTAMVDKSTKQRKDSFFDSNFLTKICTLVFRNGTLEERVFE